MVSLTFGEQVKIVLSRKGMTIKELAETIQERTGNKMSRQNLTQRLGRDNFQEQDMRMIAEILGCPFQLSILGAEEAADPAAEKNEPEHHQRLIVAGTGKHKKAEKPEPAERDITVGELVEMKEEIAKEQEAADKKAERTVRYINTDALREARREASKSGHVQEEPKRKPVTSVIKEYIKKPILKRVFEEEKPEEQPEEIKAEVTEEVPDVTRTAETTETAVLTDASAEEMPAAETEETVNQEMSEETAEVGEAVLEAVSVKEETTAAPAASQVRPQEPAGDINPYTGKEYETNSVRMHPKRIGYVQVYDRNEHKWTDMTEWAFLGYQERKKAMLGKDYEPPIYLD